MSRIGKKQILIPEKTEVTISGNMLVVKGPLGELQRELRREVSVKVEDNEVKVTPKKDSLFARALWGTYASHVNNMIDGVNKPFEKKLQVEGIGYKSEVSGDTLILNVGFSHPVRTKIPKGLTVTAEKNLITINGISKEDVGAFAAQIRSIKKPEPYKGKGVRYEGEYVRIKQGKKSV
jgi:large subunit ribosomal protein L6